MTGLLYLAIWAAAVAALCGCWRQVKGEQR